MECAPPKESPKDVAAIPAVARPEALTAESRTEVERASHLTNVQKDCELTFSTVPSARVEFAVSWTLAPGEISTVRLWRGDDRNAGVLG